MHSKEDTLGYKVNGTAREDTLEYKKADCDLHHSRLLG